MYRARLSQTTFPKFTLKDRAESRLHDWCDEQAPFRQPGRLRNLTTGQFMKWKLREDIAGLYSTKAWVTLTEQTLLEAVPDLKTWNGRDKYLTLLCVFLNGIVKMVHTDHLVGLVRDRAEEEKLEQIRAEEEARGPFAFLELPYDIRVRIYDCLVAEKYSKDRCGYRDEAFIEVPWDDCSFSDVFPERLVFDLVQVNQQLRQEFLPRWHRVVGLRFDMTHYCDPKEIEVWLKTFGESRIPLTRSFEFQFGNDLVRLDLRGKQSMTLSGDYRETIDIGTALQDEIKVSSPEAILEHECRRARKERELTFDFDFERLVKSLLVEKGRSVHLDVEGVAQIIEYLKLHTASEDEDD